MKTYRIKPLVWESFIHDDTLDTWFVHRIGRTDCFHAEDGVIGEYEVYRDRDGDYVFEVKLSEWWNTHSFWASIEDAKSNAEQYYQNLFLKVLEEVKGV